MSAWYLLELLFLTASNTLWQDALFETVIKLTALFSTGYRPQPKLPMLYVFLIIRSCKICMERGGWQVKIEGLCVTKNGEKDPSMTEKTAKTIAGRDVHTEMMWLRWHFSSHTSQDAALLYFLCGNRKTRVAAERDTSASQSCPAGCFCWDMTRRRWCEMKQPLTTSKWPDDLLWGRQRIGASTLYV